jgi:glycosyltransferase involved in cell wall biosynthesis
MLQHMSDVGIVIIGRNEGERLRRALNSAIGRGYTVTYVDSGSTDGSIELAQSMGAHVAELDFSQPFTMARGRNLGFSKLLELEPALRFVQFMDGDCELIDGWLERARRAIEEHSEAAIVCGRRRERNMNRSIYNRLADMDWDLPLGLIKYCSGDTMTRVDAFRQVGGFTPDLIAAEDTELCVRFRQRGWVILRIDADMTLHDMAMTRFGQWWRRCIRTGFAYGDCMRIHGKSSERLFVRDVRGILFWGVVLPLAAISLLWLTRGASLALLLGYGFLYWRIRRYGISRGWTPSDARLYALSCILGKFPMLIGLMSYWLQRITRRPKQLIEYRGPEHGDSQDGLSSCPSAKQLHGNS